MSLTPRELAALALVAQGCSDKEIASRLRVSRSTASKHVAAAIRKLGADNRTSAAVEALRRGISG